MFITFSIIATQLLILHVTLPNGYGSRFSFKFGGKKRPGEKNLIAMKERLERTGTYTHLVAVKLSIVCSYLHGHRALCDWLCRH